MAHAAACAAAGAIGALGCGPAKPAAPPIRFLHTFGPEETELLNAVVAERRLAVEPMVVPFARGQQVIHDAVRAGADCPDAIRIDATWLPGLVAAGLLREVPPALAALDWLPEAAPLGQLDGRWWGVPQTVDGLVVLRPLTTPAPASPSLDDLVAAARAARARGLRAPLSVRVDGYWFVPWLRAEGGELAPAGIAGDGAVRALGRFAALFGELAPPPPAAGGEAPDEVRRWRTGEVAYWITGPWQLSGLADRSQVEVSPLAHAPRGGQLLVVPRCARRPDDGWRLAAELTSPAVEARFARAFAGIPTRRAALADAPELSRAVIAALRDTALLPRDVATPLLFDDLNPTLAAVVARDATAEEAIGGLRRAWQRLAAPRTP